MCGIVGKLNFNCQQAVDAAQIREMADSIRHRGPDDEGVWTKGNIGLGHRRLSIIDLSPDGRNPMCNEDGTIWIVFNGEIYNFQDLRQELIQKGHIFKSRTDTEVILHLYEEEGSDCVRHLVGMFAFAIWDERANRLLLARDRLGKKPLYYSSDQSRLIFGSEIKSVLRSGEVDRRPRLDSIHQFFLWQCIPSPNTAFEEIKKLPPASMLVWEHGKSVQIKKYWELDYSGTLRHSEAEVVEQVQHLITEATRVRLIADVPVGLFLSGGVDSACVLASARKSHTGPIKTFSVSFGEQEFDESPYARLLARHFDTEHHEFKASPLIADLISRMAELFDEPFADSSAIPTYYLSKLTRDHVKVALSGDGGDEAFGGYQRYLAMKFLTLANQVPGARYLAGLRTLLPYGTGRRSKTRYLRQILPLIGRSPELQYEALFLGMMQAEQWKQLYTTDFLSQLNDGGNGDFIQWNHHGEPDLLSSAMAADTRRYIPECLNVKVDMASMACGLEVRSPLLDHRLVELCAKIPSSMKIKGLTQKAILKQAFKRELPKEILQRGKSGFTVPLSKWLRNELRELAHSSLLSGSSEIRSIVSQEKISSMLQEHSTGKRNWHVQLWRLLIMENWLQSAKVYSYAFSA
jgi:asparagine synthase (glutamine-hydrolysing)